MGDTQFYMHKWMLEARQELENWKELARFPLFEQIYKEYNAQKLPRGVITSRREISNRSCYSVEGQIIDILEFEKRISGKTNPMITVTGNALVQTDPALPRDTRDYLGKIMKQDFQSYVSGINLEAMIEAVRKDLVEAREDLTDAVRDHYFP